MCGRVSLFGTRDGRGNVVCVVELIGIVLIFFLSRLYVGGVVVLCGFCGIVVVVVRVSGS